MHNIHFLSFSDSHMGDALERIGREAKKSNFFASVNLFTEHDFDSAYWEQYHLWYEANKKGYGYWAWKPYFIKKILAQIDYGDYLCYCDSGCEINKSGKEKLHEYCRMAEKSKSGIVCWETGYKASQFTKGDIWDYFKARDSIIPSKNQIMAGVLVLHNTIDCQEFFDNWFITIHHNLHLIDDSPSLASNFYDFVENRHDQSVFNVLCRLSPGIIIRPGNTIELWPVVNRRVRRMKKEPFIVIRNKTGVSRLSKYNKIQLWIMNIIWDVENFFSDIIHRKYFSYL